MHISVNNMQSLESLYVSSFTMMLVLLLLLMIIILIIINNQPHHHHHNRYADKFPSRVNQF